MFDRQHFVEATRQALLLTIPRDQLALVNGRGVNVSRLTIGERLFPDNGTFTAFFDHLQHNLDLTIQAGKLRFAENGQTLTLVPRAVDVFLVKVNSQSFTAISGEGPIFQTFLHVVTEALDFYVFVASARAAQYLVHHPSGLAVNDLMHVATLPTVDSDHELNQYIRGSGYAKLVAGTGLESLDVKPGERYQWPSGSQGGQHDRS